MQSQSYNLHPGPTPPNLSWKMSRIHNKNHVRQTHRDTYKCVHLTNNDNTVVVDVETLFLQSVPFVVKIKFLHCKCENLWKISHTVIWTMVMKEKNPPFTLYSCIDENISFVFLQTVQTSLTRSWSWSWVWYGRSSCTTPSPCPCGRERSPHPPRAAPPPSSVCSTGSRARFQTCPSRTSPQTGTTGVLSEPSSMPSDQVSFFLQLDVSRRIFHFNKVEPLLRLPPFKDLVFSHVL